MESKQFGGLNPHTISLVMREAVRRAVKEIRRQRFSFEAHEKTVGYKEGEDLVTSADFAAQEIFKKILTENFPLAGIVAEENFARNCSDENHNYYFTIDPLDGTKAYGRRQSHGIASMISFIFDGVVEGSCIGDVMTEELYLVRPGGENAYRISDYEISEKLEIGFQKSLHNQYVLLRDDPRKHSSLVQKMTDPLVKTRLFKESETSGGSIGTMFARLWKGEVGAIILPPGIQTPWDRCPLIPASRKLGFKFYLLKNNTLEFFELSSSDKNEEVSYEILIIHESRVDEAMEWVRI